MTSYDARAVRRWKDALSPYRRPAPQGRPSSSALLVIDMQRYFAAMCAPIQTTVKETVEACRALGMPVFYTQHGHADPNADGGMLASWWGDLIVEGGQMLKEISQRIGLQFIINTHDQELMQIGDRAWHINKVGKVSQVKMIGEEKKTIKLKRRK